VIENTDLFPNHHLKIIPHVGHTFSAEQPKKHLYTIRYFLNQVSTYSSYQQQILDKIFGQASGFRFPFLYLGYTIQLNPLSITLYG